MNNAQQTARVGLFFILGLALTWVTFQTLSGKNIFKSKGYTLVVGFESLKELKVGDQVRMAGVEVGAVETIRLDLPRHRAEAILRIEPDVKIAADSTASIVMAGLIGTNYVGIDLGSPGAAPLAPGAEMRTKVTPDINAIMTQLGNLGGKLEDSFNSFNKAINGSGPEGGIFQKLDKMVADNSPKVTAVMTNLQEVTDKINHGEGSLGKLLNDPKAHDELVAAIDEIKAAATQAKSFVANAQSIVDQVKSGKGTIGSLVFDETAANDLKATIANLHAVSEKLAKGQGSLGKLINDDSLYLDAQTTMKKADRALDGLDDSGPITAVGVVGKSLF